MPPRPDARAYAVSRSPGPLRPTYRLACDGEELVRTRRLDLLLELLEHDATLYVAEHAPELIFVHAGVAGWRGRAIVIPGRAGHGKSTLVAALVRAGATYYSDEYAVLDQQGLVHAYPRPIGLWDGRAKRQYRVEPPPDGQWPPLPIGAVLALRYRASSLPRARRLSSGQGVLALLANTVPARTRSAEALTRLAVAIRGARLYRGTRGEADAAAARWLAACDW